MDLRRSVLAVFLVACILGSSAIYQQLRLAANEPDEQALKNASAVWYEAARTKRIRMAIPLYSPETRLRPISPSEVIDQSNLWVASHDLLSNPGFTLTLGNKPEEIRASDSLRYYVTTFEASLRGDEGKVSTWKGQRITLWKKQTDGEWKVSVDVFTA